MIKQLVLTFVFLVSVQSVIASPLLFKTVAEAKEATMAKPDEIANFDVSKYREIRVGIALVSGKFSDLGNLFRIASFDEDVMIILGHITISDGQPGNSLLVATPSGKIKIYAYNPGTYKILIWGQ